MPLTTIWGCKKILPEQDPGVLTSSQSYKVSLLHTGIGRHPVGRWMCKHILSLSLSLPLLSLDQSCVSPETTKNLDSTSTYLRRIQNLSKEDKYLRDLPLSMAFFLPHSCAPGVRYSDPLLLTHLWRKESGGPFDSQIGRRAQMGTNRS